MVNFLNCLGMSWKAKRGIRANQPTRSLRMKGRACSALTHGSINLSPSSRKVAHRTDRSPVGSKSGGRPPNPKLDPQNVPGFEPKKRLRRITTRALEPQTAKFEGLEAEGILLSIDFSILRTCPTVWNSMYPFTFKGNFVSNSQTCFSLRCASPLYHLSALEEMTPKRCNQ